MLITDAATRAGVNPQTLRYYERRGLILPAARRDSGYREYTVDQVRVVRFVKRAQELGFSLDEIEELLRLRHAKAPKPAVRALAERRLVDLDQRIDDLTRVRDALHELVGACRKGHRPECPILEALEDERRETP